VKLTRSIHVAANSRVTTNDAEHNRNVEKCQRQFFRNQRRA
jgi:hypothetical protein